MTANLHIALGAIFSLFVGIVRGTADGIAGILACICVGATMRYALYPIIPSRGRIKRDKNENG